MSTAPAATDKPPALAPRFDAMPPTLTARNIWVGWRWELRSGKWTKPPRRAHGPDGYAAVDRPDTWAPFEDAVAACERGALDGVGVRLIEDFSAIDIDGVRNPESGETHAEALRVVRAINSYTEVSPSGRGLRIVTRGALPPGWRNTKKWAVPGLEMYDAASPRYVTITGHHLAGTPPTIEERTAQLAALHAEVAAAIGPASSADQPASPMRVALHAIDDDWLLRSARTARNGDAFRRLFDQGVTDNEDHSAADFKLCGMLAFWTGRDAAQIDRLFRGSALMRAKWDERRGAQTYGEQTIARAIAACAEIYAPNGAGREERGHEQTPSLPPLSAVPAASIIEEPPPIEVIDGMAWAGCVSVLVAESGAGKSFVALGMAAAVSDGTAWVGRRVRQGSVAYLSYEGDALGLRLRALRDVAGHTLGDLYVIRASTPLSPRTDYDRLEHRSPGEQAVAAALDALQLELAARGRPPIVLVIIDTVRASMSGSEDSSECVAAYLRAVRRLMVHAPEAAGLLIHHAGWQDSDTRRQRERGSSAWRGNCDATLYIELGDELPHGGARLVLRALKVRDGARPAALYLIRRTVDIDEMGRHGQPVTTCVIERDPRRREEREAEEQAAAESAHRAHDLRVLRVIAERPDLATSLKQIRVAAGLSYPVVANAVSRCVGRGWAMPGERGKKPYEVTPAGRTALAQAPAEA